MKTIGPDRRNSCSEYSRGYSIVETLIVVVVISALAIVVFNRYEKTALEAKKTALKSELNNIRQAIVFFKITKGRYPLSLQEMLRTKVVLPYSDSARTLFTNTYLEHQAVNSNNDLLDPFGVPFRYDPLTGDVRSGSDMYKEW